MRTSSNWRVQITLQTKQTGRHAVKALDKLKVTSEGGTLKQNLSINQ
jgi:hypothetical protein